MPWYDKQASPAFTAPRSGLMQIASGARGAGMAAQSVL
jgi:hypothetical protein